MMTEREFSPERFGINQLLYLDRLKDQLSQGLQPSIGKRPGRPTDLRWNLRRIVPFSEEIWGELKGLAEKLSSPERKISPAQLATTIIEESLKTLAEDRDHLKS